MQTDRELLELAAKAVGLEHEGWGSDYIEDGPYGDSCPEGLVVEGLIWNPLTDDGDARRLAVNLRLWIRYRDDSSISMCWYDERGIFAGSVTEDGDNIEAATRRAIVRAAAAIGAGKE